MKAQLRLRLSQADAHYGGDLVDGARILGLFGDVATELLVALDGDEGLFRAYDSVEFLAPVHAGDFLEIEGEVVAIGRTSRRMRFEARRVGGARRELGDSAAEMCAPVVVVRASGTCVTPAPRVRLPASGIRSPVIITAAIVGAETTRAQTPYLPLTAQEIAEEARRCRDAGAAVVHLHVREPDGTPTQSRVRFGEAIAAIRARTDLVIQTSTGGAVGMSIAERCQPLELSPEMATLNVGTMNFGDDVFENRRPDVARVATAIRERGIVPEIEIYDAGHLDTARWLLRKELVAPPLHFQFVLGVPGGLDASTRALDYLAGELAHGFPPGSTWAVAGIGRHELPMAALAVRRGGHVRVGLEDNIFVDKGVLARGSWDLVERVATVAKAAGRLIATPEEARGILGLPSAG